MATVMVVNHPNHVNIQIVFQSVPDTQATIPGQARSLQDSCEIIENLMKLFNTLFSYLHFPLDPDVGTVSYESLVINKWKYFYY